MTTNISIDFDLEDLTRKRELADLLRRKEDLRRVSGITFYKPHPKQERFHRAAAFKRRFVRTGNRFGKTTCGVAEDISYARGERPWIPKDDPARTVGIPNRSTKGVILCQDWDKVEAVFTSQDIGESRGAIFKLLPQEWIVGVDNNHQGKLYRIRIRSIYGDVSTIQFETVKSFLQDPMAHESESWDWIHVDEPCPEEMFVAYSRGLVDRGGSAWFLCTPLTQYWIQDYFIPKDRTRSMFDAGSALMPGRWVLTGSIYDNEHLSKENIQAFIDDMPVDSRSTRIDGRPRALSGTIYKQFEPDLHIYHGIPFGWRDPYTPPDDYTIKISIDPHPQTPHAVLFMAISPGGYLYFYYEIFMRCLVRELCPMILAVPGADRAAQIICDPIAWNASSTGDGTQMIDDFREGQIYATEATKDLMRGIMRVQSTLAQRDLKGNPICYFSSEMVTTLNEFDRYVWDPAKPEPLKSAPDHMMECLYRLLLDGVDYTPPNFKTKGVPPIAITRPEFKLPDIKGLDLDPVLEILKRNELRYQFTSPQFTPPWDPTDYSEILPADRFKPAEIKFSRAKLLPAPKRF